jgi:wyosine [tRNA(Phe)-imidazoG37] synthetase (radical SAM superfamily)
LEPEKLATSQACHIPLLITKTFSTYLAPSTTISASAGGWFKLPDQLLQMRHVALSGDGEPTLADHFTEALFEINHLRTRGDLPFFKIVVVTNSTALDRPKVQEGLAESTA